MVKNNLRAVLTIFGKVKLLELRMDGLDNDATKIRVIPNLDNRHKMEEHEFVKGYMNLINALNEYSKQVMDNYILKKIMGII